jgi:hypothetical protein
VLATLLRSGWFEGRSVDVSVYDRLGMEMSVAAKAVLAEFSGLHIGECGRGIECAASDLQVDPLLCTHLVSEVQAIGDELNQSFFPIGESHRGHGYLLVDSHGRVYIFDDEVRPFAYSFDRALQKLITGILPESE